MKKLKRFALPWVVVFAGLSLALTGCGSKPSDEPTMPATPSQTDASDTVDPSATDQTATDQTSSDQTETDQTATQPAAPDSDNTTDQDPDGDLVIPDVQPNVDSDFCHTYMAYLDTGGPYSLQEAGDQLPPFTQSDLDSYTQLAATAPDDIKAQVATMLTYGQEMSKGDFTHGIDYENLLDGPGGLTLYAIAYCQIDMGSA
ncbi:MAG: hypothetical protein FWF43_00350 [Propionibacteriaceae bacterium]|nr:hypothetical protein [Propionibacteriaceae bacterium]